MLAIGFGPRLAAALIDRGNWVVGVAADGQTARVRIERHHPTLLGLNAGELIGTDFTRSR